MQESYEAVAGGFTLVRTESPAFEGRVFGTVGTYEYRLLLEDVSGFLQATN